jgi:hypothetical protein
VDVSGVEEADIDLLSVDVKTRFGEIFNVYFAVSYNVGQHWHC